MARTILKAKQVGNLFVKIARMPRGGKPTNDPGYDMPEQIFVVEVDNGDGTAMLTRTYADYQTAQNVFEDEVRWRSVMIARQAMRIRA